MRLSVIIRIVFKLTRRIFARGTVFLRCLSAAAFFSVGKIEQDARSRAREQPEAYPGLHISRGKTYRKPRYHAEAEKCGYRCRRGTFDLPKVALPADADAAKTAFFKHALGCAVAILGLGTDKIAPRH